MKLLLSFISIKLGAVYTGMADERLAEHGCNLAKQEALK